MDEKELTGLISDSLRKAHEDDNAYELAWSMYDKPVQEIYENFDAKVVELRTKTGVTCCPNCAQRSIDRGEDFSEEIDVSGFDTEYAALERDMEEKYDVAYRARETHMNRLVQGRIDALGHHPWVPFLRNAADEYLREVFILLSVIPKAGEPALPSDVYDAIAIEFSWCKEYVLARIALKDAGLWAEYVDPVSQGNAYRADKYLRNTVNAL